jgi:hypothetical protein
LIVVNSRPFNRVYVWASTSYFVGSEG